jgi:hypothetical protein
MLAQVHSAAGLDAPADVEGFVGGGRRLRHERYLSRIGLRSGGNISKANPGATPKAAQILRLGVE